MSWPILSVAVDMQELDAEVSLTIGSAWSVNTLATRNSQWTKYLDFCGRTGLQPLPASMQTVSRFLVYLGRTCKYSTVNNYLSAVVSLHKFYGYQTDFRGSYLIKLVLKGLQSMLGTHTVQMKPLTTSQLQEIYRIAVISDHDKLMWTIMILSFRSLLRKSNLVADSPSALRHVLLREDVKFYPWGLMILVRSTKTVQTGQYILEIPVFYVPNRIFCAATLVKEHVEQYPAAAGSPLFVNQGNSKPVWYRDLLGFIKRSVASIGLDPNDYGTHSMRRSGAGFLHSVGVPLEDIMVMGDWKSMAVLDYLVTPLSRKMDIQKSLKVSTVFANQI